MSPASPLARIAEHSGPRAAIVKLIHGKSFAKLALFAVSGNHLSHTGRMCVTSSQAEPEHR